MALNKNDKGLTLIELLITIAVIAIVAAISVPVITNVIDSSRTNSASAMEAQINSFIAEHTQAGEVAFNGTDEFTAWVDLDGDGVFSDPAEVVKTFTVDTSRFAVTITGTNQAPTGAAVNAAGGGNGGGNNASGNITYLAGPTTGWTAGFGQMSILTPPTFDFIALQANPTAYQIVIEGGSLAGTYQFQNLGGANMDTLVTATFSQNLASMGMFPQDSVQITWAMGSSPLTSAIMSDPSSMGMGINGTSWFNPGSNVGVVSIQLK